jgi:hypothetical protein
MTENFVGNSYFQLKFRIPFVMFVSENITGIELYQELKKITLRYTIADEKDFQFKLLNVSKLADSCGNLNCKLEQCLGCELTCSEDVLEVTDDMNILLKWNSETSFNQKEAMVIEIFLISDCGYCECSRKIRLQYYSETLSFKIFRNGTIRSKCNAPSFN